MDSAVVAANPQMHSYTTAQHKEGQQVPRQGGIKKQALAPSKSSALKHMMLVK